MFLAANLSFIALKLCNYYSSTPNDLPRDPRVHTYDVYDNELSEVLQPPEKTRATFEHLGDGLLEQSLVQTAEQAFQRLELDAENILVELLERTYSSGNPTKMNSFSFDWKRFATLRKYLIFLRFRNSAKYRDIILHSLQEQIEEHAQESIFPAFLPAIIEHRRRIILRAIIAFLQHPVSSPPTRLRDPEPRHTAGEPPDPFQTAIDTYCWRLWNAELCIGIASEEQEFMLSDACFGTLDEGFDEDPYVLYKWFSYYPFTC